MQHIRISGLISKIMVMAFVSFYVFCGEKSPKYVNAKGGLNIRAQPNSKAKAVGIFPNFHEVAILEVHREKVEIDGKVGKWMKVSVDASFRFNGESEAGWVFSGFLSDKEVLVSEETKHLVATDWKGFPKGCGNLHLKLAPDGTYSGVIYWASEVCFAEDIHGKWRIEGNMVCLDKAQECAKPSKGLTVGSGWYYPY